jgi:hypothetical protein
MWQPAQPLLFGALDLPVDAVRQKTSVYNQGFSGSKGCGIGGEVDRGSNPLFGPAEAHSG